MGSFVTGVIVPILVRRSGVAHHHVERSTVFYRSASIGRGAAMLVAIGAAVTIFATPALAAPSSKSDHGQHPPGNNGTVKIDEFPADGGNGNDPHVDCPFSVNFSGHDAGGQP